MEPSEVTSLAGVDYLGPITAILIIVIGYIIAKLVKKGGGKENDKSVSD